MPRLARVGVGLLALAASVAGAGETDLEPEVRGLIGEGQAAAAVTWIEERSPEEGRTAADWFLLAEAYHAWMDDSGLLKQRGLAKKMRRSLEAALAIDPDHTAARRELADFYHYAPWIVGGDEDEAARQLDMLEEVAPAMAWATRGAHARDAGDLETAREHYRKAVRSGPREPRDLFMLAVIEQELDAYAASLPLLDEVIAADPDHEKAYYYRARASAMAGLELDRGLECASHYVHHCTECDDSDRAYGWWRQATILKRAARVPEAIEAYRQALRLDPELEGARRGLEELEP